MKSYQTCMIFCIVFCCIALSGCSKEKKQSADVEAKRYVQELQKASEKIKFDQEQQVGSIATVTYTAANLRDPFELPATKKKENKMIYRNTILKDVALDSLKLTGILDQNNQRVAIFRANDSKLYNVTVGMRVGLQEALLIKINESSVIFQIQADPGSDQSSRDVVMTIQESK